MITMGAGLAFADFEFEFGFYGGFGNAGSAGGIIQLGYITPEYKGVAGGDLHKFRWALLADLGIGFRYGLRNKTYSDLRLDYNSGQIRETDVSYNSDGFDYNLGLITEFYFLPFMGLAVGGGVTPGLGGDPPFTPYARAQIPFLFNNVKLGLGFDYIFWNGDELPKGVDLPLGYRVNFFINLRGDAAGHLMNLFF